MTICSTFTRRPLRRNLLKWSFQNPPNFKVLIGRTKDRRLLSQCLAHFSISNDGAWKRTNVPTSALPPSDSDILKQLVRGKELYLPNVLVRVTFTYTFTVTSPGYPQVSLGGRSTDWEQQNKRLDPSLYTWGSVERSHSLNLVYLLCRHVM